MNLVVWLFGEYANIDLVIETCLLDEDRCHRKISHPFITEKKLRMLISKQAKFDVFQNVCIEQISQIIV